MAIDDYQVSIFSDTKDLFFWAVVYGGYSVWNQDSARGSGRWPDDGDNSGPPTDVNSLDMPQSLDLFPWIGLPEPLHETMCSPHICVFL